MARRLGGSRNWETGRVNAKLEGERKLICIGIDHSTCGLNAGGGTRKSNSGDWDCGRGEGDHQFLLGGWTFDSKGEGDGMNTDAFGEESQTAE